MNNEQLLEYRKMLGKKTLEVISEEPKTITEKHINNLQLETFRIEEVNLYATKEEAEEALKKLEEK